MAGRALAGLKAGLAANARRAGAVPIRDDRALLVEALRSATLSLIGHAERLQDPAAMAAACHEIGLYRSVLRRHEAEGGP